MSAAKEQSRLLSALDAVLADAKTLPGGNGNLAAVLNSGKAVRVPDALASFHLASPQEKARRVRDVLVRAWRVYRRGERSMLDSINDGAGVDAAGEYAKISLRRILLELNLTAWETHPARSRDDVHALFRKAIGKLTPHRGGWVVAR